MRGAVAALVTVALIVTQSAPVGAYLKFGVRVGNTTVNVKWNRLPISYFVTERATPEVSATQFRDAITRAFTTWQSVPSAAVRTAFAGVTVAPPGFQDTRNTLGFLDRPDLDRVLGATSFLLDAGTGEIVEADIFFNTRFTWSTAAAGEAGRVDLESVAVHEIGHLLGLGHSAIGETELIAGGGRRVTSSGSVMFPIAFAAGSIADRLLQRDDVAGVTDLYPASGGAAQSGSVSGRVLKDGRGVFGAHVVAFNMTTGALIGNFSLNEQGEFVISGLDPGPHLLRAEPLDDADVESFFTGPADVNFRIGYSPTVVFVPAGGGAPPVDITVRPK
jgi:hypothetical protein